MSWTQVPTAWGTFAAHWEEDRLTALLFPTSRGTVPLFDNPEKGDSPRLAEQLDAYFAGRRQAFAIPLQLPRTAFRQRVWGELLKLPYGTLVTYGELARRVGCPPGARAVGQAVGANPIPILVPCHRVVASGGRLGGFGAGLEWKRRLLSLERGGEGTAPL